MHNTINHMILDPDEQIIDQTTKQQLSYELLRGMGCVILDSFQRIQKLCDLRIASRLINEACENTDKYKKYIEEFNKEVAYFESLKGASLWKFTYKGHEIFFHTLPPLGGDDGYTINVVFFVGHCSYAANITEFFQQLENVITYQYEVERKYREKFFIIKKNEDSGKTYQKSVQRNLLCKQRLSQFQTRTGSYRPSRMFRNRNR